MQLSSIYVLPELHYIAGEYISFYLGIKNSSGTDLDSSQFTGYFSITNFADWSQIPVIKIPIHFVDNGSGITSVGLVEIPSSQTLSLSGKYTYQITIFDATGRCSIKHGIMLFDKNGDLTST